MHTSARRSFPTEDLRHALFAGLIAWGLLGLAGEAQARGRPAAARKKGAPAAGLMLSCGKDVSVRSATSEWRDCELGQVLSAADRVRTGRTGLATLETDGTRLWLDPSTQVLLGGGKKGKGGLQVEDGAVRIAVQAGAGKGKPLQVMTPGGEVRLRGVARIEVGSGEARLAVYEGQAEAGGKRGGLKVAAGTGAILHRAGKNRAGALIGAPGWESAGEPSGGQLFFALPQKSPAEGAGGAVADVALPFRAVEGAVRYRLEIGRDEALTDRVQVGTIPAETRQVTARLFTRGRYFVRLQAVDTDQVAGPGPVQALEIAEVRGDRLQAEAASGGGRVPLLTAAGEMAFEVVSSAGHLQGLLDGKLLSEGTGSVSIKVGRGPHRVMLSSEGGMKGELRLEVSRPSYSIEIGEIGEIDQMGEEKKEAADRRYKLQVRALDAAGQLAQGGKLQVRTAPVPGNEKGSVEEPGQPLELSARATGLFTGELQVRAGQTLRVVVSDADGPLASADLHGPGATP